MEVFKKTPLLERRLFWDVDGEKLEPERDWFFIIERIVEYGDLKDFEWLKENFPSEKIRYVLKTSRILSKKTLNLLKLLYED